MTKTTNRFDFCGGNLALDFANTVSWRLGKAPVDNLASYDDLLRWAREARTMSSTRASALRKEAKTSRSEARKVLRAAIELREVVYRIADALIRKRQPVAADVELLNAYLAKYLGSARVGWMTGRLVWQPQGSTTGLAVVIEPMVRAAAELFTSEPAGKIARCQDDRGCGWVFVDHSRSQRRRWCSMSSCGNRAKVRRHYHRS